jgi:glycosyltransferase involved in cell wall biosynthesis
MKRIAILAPSFPKLTETFIRTEIDALQELGHDVSVMTFHVYPLSHVNYPVIHIQSIKLDYVLLFKQLFKFTKQQRQHIYNAIQFVKDQHSLSKLSLLYHSFKLAFKLRQQGIEHIHAHFAQHTCAHAIVAAKIINIPCSFVAHGHDLYVAPFDIALKLQHSDLAVAVCQDMLIDLQAYYPGNIQLLHCGVNTDKFLPPPNLNVLPHLTSAASATLRMVFVGRLIEQKGLTYLINALSLLPTEIVFELAVIGDGELKKQLEAQVKALNLTREIIFVGEQDSQWLSAHLANFDVLVAPFCRASSGSVDTGPLVLKEAMAVSLPVITTDLMGCKEIVVEGTGFIVKQKSSQALADIIQYFNQLTDEQRKQIGRDARTHIEQHFDSVRQTKQLSDWIEHIEPK